MEYKTGYKIKPYQTQVDGVVRFTDGTNHDLLANEITCNAYGYYYDKDMAVCRAFNPNNQIFKIGKSKSKFNTKKSLVIGSNNILSQNKNTFVAGSENVAENRVYDGSIIGGTFGKLSYDGEIVVGGGITGGAGTGTSGNNQFSIVSLTGHTRGDDITLKVQGDGLTEIRTTNNTVMIYEVFITGICTGGDDGTAGNHCAYKFRGVCKTNNDGANDASTPSEWKEVTGSTGTPSLDFTDNNIFHISVSGAANTNASWSAVVNRYINRTATEI